MGIDVTTLAVAKKYTDSKASGGNFVITASSVTATTFAVDKTPTEVLAAITAGKMPELNITTLDSNVYKLVLSTYKADCSALNFETTILGTNTVFGLTIPSGGTAYEGTISDKVMNTVSVSASGTATEEIEYITVDGVEKKIGGGGASFDLIDEYTPTQTSAKEVVRIYNANGCGGIILPSDGDVSSSTSRVWSTGYRNIIATQATADKGTLRVTGSNNFVTGVINGLGGQSVVSGSSNFIGTKFGANYSLDNLNHSADNSLVLVGRPKSGGGNGLTCIGELSIVATQTDRSRAKTVGTHSLVVEGCPDDYSSTTGAYIGQYCQFLGASLDAGGTTYSDAHNYQMVSGKYNVAGDYARIIGIGTYGSRANGFTLDWSGNGVFAGTVTPSGADYAEYFEWEDGNPEGEDRMGYIVALNGNKIVLANGDDILGIASATKAVIGDAQEMNWSGKYVRDDFGRIQYDDYDIEHEAIVDEEGHTTQEAWTEHIHAPKISEDFDPTQEYIPRSKRKEWYPIGLLGKIIVRDDGTAQAGGYVTATNGIATASESKTSMRVLERINDHLVKVFLK